MKIAMRPAHGSAALCRIAESMLRCNIRGVSWEEFTVKGTKAMITRSRPIHSGFESLRIAGMSSRSTQDYHRFGSATNEQLRSEEHTSELQSLMRISYAVFCLIKKNEQIH